MAEEEADLRRIASEIRGKLVQLSHARGVPHLASALSAVDILVAIYWGSFRLNAAAIASGDRDRFALSKGHAAPALYATLWRRGALDETVLDALAEPGQPLAEQPAPGCVPGVEWATGSLGHGLSVAIGMLLAARIRARPLRAAVLLGDGECNEGSVWEAAMFAAGQKLTGLTAVIDWNRWQATARSEEPMGLSPLREKWAAFGWEAREVDGHDIEALQAALEAGVSADKPLALIARTVKGKGVDFMEDDNNWHYRIPDAEEVAASLAQLDLA